METVLEEKRVPEGALRSLAALRQKLRRVFVAEGAATIAFGTCGALAGSFVLDYFLVLPVGVRLIFLAGGLVLLCAQVRKKVGSWITRPISDEDLANLVERSQPELGQSLITAVELTRSGNEAATYVSSSLLDSVVRSVEGRVARIRFREVIPLGRLYGRSTLLAGALCVLLAAALLEPELSGIWLRRNLLLGSVAWPKSTRLELVSPQLPAVVAVGEPLEVVVRAVRGEPQAVRVFWTESGQRERHDSLNKMTSGVYRKLFPPVSRPFDFRVAGGDDGIGPFHVDVKLRPRIDMQSIRLWCEYPAYTGLPATPAREPMRYGNLKVPVGTRVRYRLSANVPVRSAYFVFRAREGEGSGTEASRESPAARRGPEEDGDDSAGVSRDDTLPSGADAEWPDPGAVALEIEDSLHFEGEFSVEESGYYYFQIESLDAFRNARPDPFRVEAVADRDPLVRIVVPDRVTEKVSPEATVRIRVAANDDYGILQGAVHGLYFETPGAKGQIRSYGLPLPKTDETAAELQREVEEEILLRIGELPASEGATLPPAGASFQYKALATDHGGNTGESRMHFLEVVDKTDLLRDLGDRLMVVRDQLREARQRQESARQDLAELATELFPAGEISQDDARKLVRHQQNQRGITRAVERGAEDLERVLERSLLNKVGDDKWRGWVAGIQRDLEGLASEESKDAEESLGALRKDALETPQALDRLGLIEGQQRQVERELDHLVLRLTEFGDMNALIQMLREVRRRQEELREDTRARIPEAGPEEGES